LKLNQKGLFRRHRFDDDDSSRFKMPSEGDVGPDIGNTGMGMSLLTTPAGTNKLSSQIP
jgi:hypothetical protein